MQGSEGVGSGSTKLFAHAEAFVARAGVQAAAHAALTPLPEIGEYLSHIDVARFTQVEESPPKSALNVPGIQPAT
jgi:hypothetical protein